MASAEDATGDTGRVSGSLYSGDHEHYAYLGEVFSRFSHANVLQRDMYPSATKFEGEIIAMVLDLLHGDAQACGVVTSGGSESLITALYSYREAARERGVTNPNVVMPVTAHVALDKGAYWMDIEVRHAPLTESFTADVAAMAGLLDDQTIALVGSAGDYAHGLIDPIEDIAALAVEHGIGMHVDGCLGGLLWPWAEELGYPIPRWDFRVPGVTSISADTHKYGYALKGTSTLTYRSKDLRRRQYFTYPDWPGGLYLSPGLAGSRSGGVIAATWAGLVTTGRSGYLAAAQSILETGAEIRNGIEGIEGLRVIGDPTLLIAFMADEPDLDIYLVNDALKKAGWRMNALQLPPALHFCVTRPNTEPDVAQTFLADLRHAVQYARDNRGIPAESGAMPPSELGAGRRSRQWRPQGRRRRVGSRSPRSGFAGDRRCPVRRVDRGGHHRAVGVHRAGRRPRRPGRTGDPVVGHPVPAQRGAPARKSDQHRRIRAAYVGELVRRSGRNPALLPELVPTGSVQGALQPGPAARLGLRPGVPVACGIPDIHAAIVGSGAVRPYQNHLAISNTAWLSAPVPFKRTDIAHSIATLPGLTPDANIVGDNIDTGAAALSWLRDKVLRTSLGYEQLTALAASAPPGCEGVIFTPWLAGERSPVEDKHLRAGFLNLSLRTDQAMPVRAVLEGVAFNIGWLFGYYQKFLKRPVPSVRIIGGDHMVEYRKLYRTVKGFYRRMNGQPPI